MIKKIILVSHTHTDIGYTEMPHKVMAMQVNYLREAIRLAREAEAKNPPERFPWTIEAMVVVREFLQVASEEEKQEFFDFARRGLIEITGYDGQIQTQLMNLQELDEELKFARTLAENERLPLHSVVLDDIGGFSWNLPQLLNQCGIRNYVMGVGGWRVLSPIANLPHLFRLRGVDGQSSVLVYLPGLKKGGNPAEVKFLLAQYGFGLIYLIFPYRGTPVTGDFSASERFDGDEALLSLVKRFEDEGYPYDTLLLQNGSDNIGQYHDLPEAVRRWNSRYPQLQLEVGTFDDFFDDIEARYGAAIPELSGELTCTWSEHVLTHGRGLGLMHEARRKLAIADALMQSIVLSDTERREFLALREEAIDQIRLFCDHTFGLEAWGFRQRMAANHRLHSGGRVNDYSRESWEFKEDYAQLARMQARKAMRLLEKSIIRRSPAPVDESTRFSNPNCPAPEVTFFNPLPYPVSGMLRFHGEYLAEVQLEIDGKKIDCDAVYNNNSTVDYFLTSPSPIPAGGFLHAIIHHNAELAEFQSPFELEEAADTLSVRWDEAVLKICRKSGAILSWQLRGVELQDDCAGTHINDFKGYLVDGVLPTAKELGLTEKVVFQPIEQISGQVAVTYHGRTILTIQLLRLYGQGEKTIQVESEIELRVGTPELFIRNRVRKISDFRHEAGYFVFPIRVDRKNWKLETNQQGYIHDYRSEKLEGAALQNFAFQDFAVISDGQNGAMLESFHAGIMSVGETPKYFTPDLFNRSTEAPHLFLYCYNNLWVTNTPQEQLSGDLFFDVAVSPFAGDLPEDSGSYSSFAAKRLQEVVALSGRVENEREFLAIDSDKIAAYYVNENENLILHLVNYSRKPQTFTYHVQGKSHTITLQGSEIFRQVLEKQ